MTSFSTNRRSRWSKAFGIFSLVVLTSLTASPWLLREWHAWRGHKLFLEKKFIDASSHLVHVRDRATLVAHYFRLPPMKYLYAQSLLAAGRNGDAVRQYSELADLDPRDGTLALIIALHDWTSGNWASAIARLDRHRDSPVCPLCKGAHRTFHAATLAQPNVVVAQREQEAHLASMNLPAQCILYRGGSAAVDVLITHVLSFLGAGMGQYFQTSGMTEQAMERAVAIGGSLIRERLKKLIEDAVDLEVRCAQRVRMHEMLRLKDIPLVAGIEQWVEFRTLDRFVERLPYVRVAQNALAARPHLHELGALAVAYAMAYKAESDARRQIQEADAYAGSAWGVIKLAAQDPEFATKGVALIPGEKSWLETIKSYVWPF